MKKAYSPEEITNLFLEYLTDGNVEGVVSLFEKDAIVATGAKSFAKGRREIEAYFTELISHKPQFGKLQHSPAIVNGNIALTSTRVPSAFTTVEVCRKQEDGNWLWIIDQPDVNAKI